MPDNLLLTTVKGQPDLEHVKDLHRRLRLGLVGPTTCSATRAGRIWDIETSGERWAWLDGSPPPPEAFFFFFFFFFAHTNHYVTPELAPQDVCDYKGTIKRRARAEALLAAGLAAGTDPVALGQSGAFRDHANEPLSVSALTGTTTTRTPTRASRR